MAIGIMEVTVVGAKDLKNTELFGKIDPYVIIEYKNQEQRSTNGSGRPKSHLKCCLCLRGQGTNPVWNEKFKFKVQYKPGADEQHKLILKIMDHDNFTADDYLGQATIYLKDLFEQGMENGKAELRTQKYRVVSNNKTYHGEIQVGIIFIVNGENDQQENGGLKEDKS